NLTSVCLNIYFHIVRDDNGTGGINPNQIPLIMDDLNSQYNNLGIFFINSGTAFIDQTSYLNIGDSTEAENLGQVNNQSTAINYYIVDALWNVGTGFVSGTANSIPSNNLVIRNDRVLTSTSAHEIGHCLDLYHTFQGTASNTSGCAESIDGSNCSSCGDLVCDTPADANIGSSGGYSPDLNNVMSYYLVRNNLTTGQSSRMLDAINNNPLLSQTISNSCAVPELSPLDFLCYSNSETLVITNIDNNTATWQTSSNLNIVSFTTSSITIEPDNSFVSGIGWVEATLNTGLIIREEFWIGNPSATGLYFYSSGNFEISTHRWYQFTAHHQNFSYLEHGQLTYEWQIPYAQLRMNPPKDKVISVYPTQTGVYPYKVRSKNSCGCSSWVTQYYTVEEEPGDDDYYIGPAGN
ncbi:M43 family zinc metalloprotease, partial [Flavobacteriaceae bacterium]|nr:M43 family zinc metalloprotease [Flavobacteriaceae bacterium]